MGFSTLKLLFKQFLEQFWSFYNEMGGVLDG
jgi:hypothetical protein